MIRWPWNTGPGSIRFCWALLLALALALAGCTSMGPNSVMRDNFAYNDALGSAWNRQMLLNMVKLRYGEAPVFLNVASVIDQYAREGQVSLFSPGWDRPSTAPIAGASGRWSDRPTITYAPVSGEQFTRSLLTPISPISLLGMIQSGWPVEFVFGMAVRSVNGIANGTRAPLLGQSPDPRFGELLKAMTAIQRSSAIDIRIDRRLDGDTAILVLQRGEAEEVMAARRTVRRILDLEADVDEFLLEYGAIADKPNAVAILTRSLLEIIGEFSFGIEVPQQDLDEGRTEATRAFSGTWAPPTIRIQSGEHSPADAFVAIPYRGRWFWIDDRDYRGKRMFSFMLLLTSLAETGSAPNAPLITVGAGS